MARSLKQPLMNDGFVNQAIARSRERSQTLGDLCKFDLMSVDITPEELFKKLDDLGFEDWSPVPIRKKTAARKAITRIKHILEDPGNDLKVMARRVPTSEPDVIRYAIVDERVDNQRRDLDYSTRNQVIFRVDTGALEFTGDTIEPLLEMYDYLCGVYTETEITRMVKNIVDTHGCIWMHDKSGMFFMGRGHKGTVDSLVKLFKFLGELTDDTCYFRPISILDDAENRATMGEALVADISLELGEATEMLDRAVDEESAKSLTHALKRFKIAKGKAAMYQSMLQINMDGIEGQLKHADQKAGQLMHELTVKKAKK